MREKKKRTRMAPRGIAVIMLAVVVGWWIGDGISRRVKRDTVDFSSGIEPDGTFAADYNETTEPPTEAPPQATTDPLEDVQQADFTMPSGIQLPDSYVTVEQDVTAMHSGRLLQLDSTHGYSGNDGAYGTFAGEKNGSYKLRFGELETYDCVVSAMNSMASAYETVTGENDLMIYSTTSACGVAGSLYPDVLPDRESGYCIDLSYSNEDGSISPMYEMDAWLAGNAHLYGFVFDYTEADREATGVESAPYHLRYIGKVHSMLMHERDMTFAAYLEAVKSHTLDAPFTYNDGNYQYKVYYVPAGSGTTNVPVPKSGQYEISGNNTDGFIVTAWE